MSAFINEIMTRCSQLSASGNELISQTHLIFYQQSDGQMGVEVMIAGDADAANQTLIQVADVAREYIAARREASTH